MSMKLKKIVRESVGTDSGQSSDITSIKNTIGKASGQGAGGILKDVADLKTALGDEDTAASILGRIKALEDAANTGGTE